MSIVFRSPNSDQEFEQYFKFRWELLRKPLGLERGSEQDHLERSAFHIAAFYNVHIIAVGRLQIENEDSARIRYMAVDSNYRRQGVGSTILKQLEQTAGENNITTCWLLAREEVVPFYLKNNYEIQGVANSEIDIPHQRMQKLLFHN